MRKVSAAILCLFIGMALLCSCAGAGQVPDTEVRVLVIDGRDSFVISLKGKYAICETGSDKALAEGPFLSGVVSAAKNGLIIGKKEVGQNAITIKVVRDGNIYIDGRRFRGAIDIIKKSDGKLMVVNRLGLDGYLYGVLYNEVSHRWPMEVLKAQAITARTFALYEIRQSRGQLYDLRNDIYSQVYGGRTSEKWATTTAVDRTRGQILVYNGDIFPAYYHATCGGYTEDAANLWNVNIEPLKGSECGFCSDSPHYRWSKDIPVDALEKKLKGGGYKIGNMSSIAVLSKNRSGRVDKLEIKDGFGRSVVMSGKDFRHMLGPNEVRSANFEISMRPGIIRIDGIGWGHGVGMCQWGAYGMSRKGFKAAEILRRYYPGAEISTIDKIKM